MVRSSISLLENPACGWDEEEWIMRSCLLGLAGIIALLLTALASPSHAAPATVDASQLPAGVFQGTLRRAPGTDRMFTVTVSVPQVTANPNVRGNLQLAGEINHIHQLQQKMARSKNPASQLASLQLAILRLQHHAARVQASSVSVHHITQHIDFQAAEDVKVRTAKAPEVVDDKGKPRKPTAEELKQFKGKDANLAGYEASLDALAAGQSVQVTLAHRPAASDAEKGKEVKAAEKNADQKKPTAEDTGEKKMQVKLIVILGEGAGSGRTETPGKAVKVAN
jgi:hypothetical protein